MRARRARWTADKVHTSVWLSIAQIEMLERAGGGDRISKTIRRAIDEFLARRTEYAELRVRLAQANLDDAVNLRERTFAEAARARELEALRNRENEDAAFAFLIKNGRTVDDTVRDRKGRTIAYPTRSWLESRADDLARFGLTPSTALELIHRRTTK